MNLERLNRSGRPRLEQRSDTKPLTLTGYGAVFYRAGDPATEYPLGYGGIIERIMPSAFDRALGLVDGKAADDVRCLFNHDSNLVLGRTTAGTLKLSRDATGLLYECELPKTSTASDLAELLRRGEVNGSSFSFVAEKIVWIEEGTGSEARLYRELHSVVLYDVGPVTFPAYVGTSAGLRHAGGRSAEPKDRAVELRAEFDAWRQQAGGSRAADVRRRAMRARLVELSERERQRGTA